MVKTPYEIPIIQILYQPKFVLGINENLNNERVKDYIN